MTATVYFLEGASTEQRKSIPTAQFMGIYAHGELEQELGFDIISVEVTEDDTVVGIPFGESKVELLNVQYAERSEAVLFYWVSDSPLTRDKHRGLLCKPTDTEAIGYARRCMARAQREV